MIVQVLKARAVVAASALHGDDRCLTRSTGAGRAPMVLDEAILFLKPGCRATREQLEQ